MTHWRFSVGEYTTPHLTFAEDLVTYRAAGAEGIGIDEGLKLRDPKNDLAQFRDSGLVATFCFPSVSTVFAGELSRGPGEPDLRVDQMCEGIKRLAEFDPGRRVCATGPSAAPETAEVRRIVVDGIRRAAKEAREQGVRLAIEPMHASKRSEWSFITTIPDAVNLIDEVGEEDIGLVVDVWHLWDTPNIVDHLRENVERIFGVHVNDWRDPTRSWCDRVLPGDGVANAPAFLGALAQGGYQGWLELEIFSDDGLFGNDFADSLWKRPPEELIRSGLERTVAAWNAGRAANGIET